MAVVSMIFATGALNAKTVSEKINFNREWRFQIGDHKGAEKNNYNDYEWDIIGLPHSFSIPYFLSQDFYVGYGWYRKSFDIPESYKGKKIYIEFEAVFQEAEIFVNGQKAGEHQGGYTGFVVDITDFIGIGKNTLAVRVNNLWNAQVAPRAGEHVFSGGIYRDVYLLVKNPLHVDWYGTFVTTPEVSKESAVVNVKTDVLNTTSSPMEVKLETVIISPTGKQLEKITSLQTIPANGKQTFDQSSKKIGNPSLWHPDSPSLYKAVSKVYHNGKPTDEYETVFGIRWFEWTADKGFFLNGERYIMRGANVHQDQAGWGDAVTNSAIYRDVQMVKDAGFNLARGSHYPHDPAFSKACDEIGLLFWSENAFWGTGGFSRSDGYWNSSAYPIFEEDRAGFDASVKKQLEEMIRIHRNHPSVIIWSMSNEPFFSAEGAMEGMKKLLRETVELTHRLDASRPAAVGGAQRPLGKDRIDLIGDVAGYNGDGGVLPDFQNPGIPNMVSEYGSVTAERPGDYAPGWGDLVKNDSYKGYEWRSGQAIWCMFDHGSIAGSRLGKMGIVDYFRVPKRAFYWYRNEYRNIPPPVWAKEGIPAKLKLEADKTSAVRTDGTDDIMLMITVLDKDGTPVSNSPSVKLEVVSGPGEFPTGSSIVFDNGDIRIADGKAAIGFRSYYAGKSLVRASGEGLEPAEISVNFEGDVPYIEGITPKVKNRPYVRFNRLGQRNIVQTFGRNNPTFPTSSKNGFTGAKATDGDRKSWWEPADDDPNPAWILDTERGLKLKSISISFPEPALYKYTVSVSTDQNSWQTVFDNPADAVKEDTRYISLPNDTEARFVRISFDRKHTAIPRIGEVEVTGIMTE